uniref:Uncharacterized protein n=1 Tax=Arundo donax TaxID=35708 RepID=A0A0A9G299_ARUDO
MVRLPFCVHSPFLLNCSRLPHVNVSTCSTAVHIIEFSSLYT